MARKSAWEGSDTKTEKSFFFSLRSRMVAMFGLIFLATFSAIVIIETFGLPQAGVKGELRAQYDETLNTLNFVADLKKERLSLWLDERKGDVSVASRLLQVNWYSERVGNVIRKKAESGVKLDEAAIKKISLV